PNRDECIEAFQWVAKELNELGGQASLCEGQFFDDVTDDDIELRFIEARNADYADISTEARGIAKLLKTKRVAAEKIAALAAQTLKLRRRFDETVAVDFCHAPGREPAHGLLVGVERSLSELRGDSQDEPLERL